MKEIRINSKKIFSESININWKLNESNLKNKLLKLSRTELIKLCKNSKVSTNGYKHDMIDSLIKKKQKKKKNNKKTEITKGKEINEEKEINDGSEPPNDDDEDNDDSEGYDGWGTYRWRDWDSDDYGEGDPGFRKFYEHHGWI